MRYYTKLVIYSISNQIQQTYVYLFATILFEIFGKLTNFLAIQKIL